MNDVEVVTVAVADRRFGVRELFGLNRVADEEEVVVFAGDTHLDSLRLDFQDLDRWARSNALLGVVADGHLTVDDWIINGELDFGPFLLVRGDVRAKNVATAGSDVLITGNLDVAQTFAGIYNHGRTTVKGDTRAQVVITSEHLTAFHGTVTADFALAGNYFTIADHAQLHLGGRIGQVYRHDGTILTDPAGLDVNRSLRLVDPRFQDFDDKTIVEAMQTGQSLLRGPQPPLSGPLHALTDLDRIRVVLLRAGCPESQLSTSGFRACRSGEIEGFEVWFDRCADDVPTDLDPATQLGRYAHALRTAGYQVDDDYDDDPVLLVEEPG